MVWRETSLTHGGYLGHDAAAHLRTAYKTRQMHAVVPAEGSCEPWVLYKCEMKQGINAPAHAGEHHESIYSCLQCIFILR